MIFRLQNGILPIIIALSLLASSMVYGTVTLCGRSLLTVPSVLITAKRRLPFPIRNNNAVERPQLFEGVYTRFEQWGILLDHEAHSQNYPPIGETITVNQKNCVIVAVLGFGQEGINYLVVVSGKYRAVKLFHQRMRFNLEGFLQEVSDLQELGNKGINATRIIDHDPTNLTFLTDYHPGYSLEDIQKHGIELGFTPLEIERISRQFDELNIQFKNAGRMKVPLLKSNAIYNLNKGKTFITDTG